MYYGRFCARYSVKLVEATSEAEMSGEKYFKLDGPLYHLRHGVSRIPYLCSVFLLLELANDVIVGRRTSVTSNVALMAGSSKQGNTFRASVGCIWVVAMYLKTTTQRQVISQVISE